MRHVLGVVVVVVSGVLLLGDSVHLCDTCVLSL